MQNHLKRKYLLCKEIVPDRFNKMFLADQLETTCEENNLNNVNVLKGDLEGSTTSYFCLHIICGRCGIEENCGFNRIQILLYQI